MNLSVLYEDISTPRVTEWGSVCFDRSEEIESFLVIHFTDGTALVVDEFASIKVIVRNWQGNVKGALVIWKPRDVPQRYLDTFMKTPHRDTTLLRRQATPQDKELVWKVVEELHDYGAI